MERMKVKGAQAQRLKPQVCVEANQLRAPRGEQSLGQLLLGLAWGVCRALGCSVSLDAV